MSEDGSLFKVPLTKILAINNHPGADRLEVAMVYGFQVVVRKGLYQVGDIVIYVPIDSILPHKLEMQIFPPDSKIKLHHNRVRQIRIRGLASQGMLINPLEILGDEPTAFDLEENLAEELGITKYEPPIKGASQTVGKDKQRNKKHENPLFHKYNGVDNVKWFPNLFDDKEVVIQEKLHGTNARAGILPYAPNTLWKKFKKLVGLAPKYEKVYGSNNVDISSANNYTGFYGEDVYGDTFETIDIFSKLNPGEIVYGEIIGPNIQKNYDYNCKWTRFVMFDVKIIQPDGKFLWLNPEAAEGFAKSRGFEFVPVLYKGLYNKEETYKLTQGPSVYDPKTKVREGIVIKLRENYDNEGNKVACKWINEIYLDDKSNSDEH